MFSFQDIDRLHKDAVDALLRVNHSYTPYTLEEAEAALRRVGATESGARSMRQWVRNTVNRTLKCRAAAY